MVKSRDPKNLKIEIGQVWISKSGEGSWPKVVVSRFKNDPVDGTLMVFIMNMRAEIAWFYESEFRAQYKPTE